MRERHTRMGPLSAAGVAVSVGLFAAVVIAGVPGTVDASDDASSRSSAPQETFWVGTWTVEKGRHVSTRSRDSYVLERAHLIEPRSGWELRADRVQVTLDRTGKTELVFADGEVRLAHRGRSLYLMGDVALLEPTGHRGVVTGQNASVVRGESRFHATRVDVDLRGSELAMVGVRSGFAAPIRDNSKTDATAETTSARVGKTVFERQGQLN